jgi:small subunit ribosomal protein S17
MAEETNENAEPTTDAPEAVEAPAPAESAPSAPVESAPSAPAQSAPAAKAEPQEVLAPKERRRRLRATKAAKLKPRGARTAEERQADRVGQRAKKAQERRVARAHAKAKATPGDSAATPARERAPGVQKVRQGVVVSDKADKTITVRIDVARRHRRYQKIVRTSNTLHAHDERNDAHIGDTVIVREARPLSRTKRWRLVSVLERAK